jgi:hypothetical protein
MQEVDHRQLVWSRDGRGIDADFAVIAGDSGRRYLNRLPAAADRRR